jgi:hypothetical protein
MTQLPFNAAQFEPSSGLNPWVDGWHPVVLTSIEPKGNQGGDSGRLECVIQALDGPHKGTNQRFGLNLWHSNPQTVEIANRFLSAITYVTIGMQGRLNFNDTSELLNIPFLIQASRQKDNPNMNNFNAVKDVQGGDPKTGTGRGQVQIVSAAPTGAAPAHSFTPPNGAPAFAPPPAAGGPAPFAPPPAATAPAPAGWAPPGGAAPAAAPAPAPAGWAPPQGAAPAPAQQYQQPQQSQFQQPAPAAPAPGGWTPPGGAPAPAGGQPSWMPPR